MESSRSKLSFSIERILTTQSSKKNELNSATQGMFIWQPYELNKLFYHSYDRLKNERFNRNKSPYEKKDIKCYCKLLKKEKVSFGVTERSTSTESESVKQEATLEKLKGEIFFCFSCLNIFLKF